MGKGTTFTLKFPLLCEIPQLEAPVEIQKQGECLQVKLLPDSIERMHRRM